MKTLLTLLLAFTLHQSFAQITDIYFDKEVIILEVIQYAEEDSLGNMVIITDTLMIAHRYQPGWLKIKIKLHHKPINLIFITVDNPDRFVNLTLEYYPKDRFIIWNQNKGEGNIYNERKKALEYLKTLDIKNNP